MSAHTVQIPPLMEHSQSAANTTSFRRTASSIKQLRKSTFIQRILSVRVLILVSFSVLVVSVGLISYATASVSFKSTTSDLSDQILENVVLRVTAQTRAIFEVPYNMVVSANRELATKNAVDYISFQPIQWRVWNDANNYLFTFAATMLDGSFFGYGYLPPYLAQIYFNKTESTTGVYGIVTDYVHGLANFSAYSIPVPDVDVSLVPYYNDVLQQQQQLWSSPYLIAGINTNYGSGAFLTSAAPMFHPITGALAGVFAATVSTLSLQTFLKEIYVSKNAVLWVMDPIGIMLACSNPLENINNNRSVLSYGQASNLEIVRAASLLALQHNTSDTFQVTFSHGGKDINLNVNPINTHDLDLLLVVAYPMSDFLGGVQKIERNILIITCCVLVGAIGVGIGVMYLVTAPLSHLGKQMDEISIGEFESTMLNRSAIKSSRLLEIHALQNDFHSMVNAVRSFGKYVPVDVVRHLLLNDTEAVVAVSQKEVTVMFSDIKGFTQKVEEMSPSQLSVLLSDYLSSMCSVISDNAGTVDKFIGDAIMALWNAPSPVKNHPFHACAAALESLRALEKLNVKWRMNGLPEIHCRIGIHTGKALVGNLGSNERLSYTAVGDNINLGSRLEALNKKYGTSVSNFTSNRFAFFDQVFLDVVVVQGRTTPTPVYELVTAAGTSTPEQHHLCKSQGEAVDLFFSRKFSEALIILNSLQVAYPNEAQSNTGLTEDWKGYCVLDEK